MSFEVTFRIFTDEESSMLCAAGVDHAIHTYAKTWNKLIKNIHEAVECHSDVPYTQVKITLIETHDVEAQESRNVRAAYLAPTIRARSSCHGVLYSPVLKQANKSAIILISSPVEHPYS